MSFKIQHYTLIDAQLRMPNSKLNEALTECIVQWENLRCHMPFPKLCIVCTMKVAFYLAETFAAQSL
jgi:hypothetical protein